MSKMNIVHYDENENVYYVKRDEFISFMIELVADICKKSFNGKRIFNAWNVVRQNYLTICETPEYLAYVFDTEISVQEKDDDEVYYRGSWKYEDEVVGGVINKLGLVELEIADVY